MVRSRLSRVKSKRATRQATFYVILSALIIFGMIAWGIPEAARLAGLLIQTDNGPGLEEELRPTPPIFSDIPESTKVETVDLSGFAQPGVEVALYLNGAKYKELLSDDAGVFHFDNVELTEGDNVVYAKATTSRGTESEISRRYTITVDSEAPELILDSPSDGQVYHGENERIAEFRGMVQEEGLKVYIGERVAILRTDGTFTLSYQMQEGDQEVSVKVVDKAGNETEKVVKVRWEP